jgi:hypothetical protein
MKKQHPGRVFLVGCPRSGTTLLQSLLFAHPDVMSFPETFFFVYAANGRGRRRRLGLASKGVGRAFARLDEIGLGEEMHLYRPGTIRACAGLFCETLDQATVRAGKRLWVEKTPGHLHRIAIIERYVPGARFIHLIRAKGPTVASLRRVSAEYPQWDGTRSQEECEQRWERDVGQSRRFIGRDGHLFVSYERLVDDTETVLRALCDEFALSDETAAMLDGYAEKAAAVVRPHEQWKQRAFSGIVATADRPVEGFAFV